MATRKFKITIEGKAFEAEVEEIGETATGQPAAPVQRAKATPPPAAAPQPGSGNDIVAPMPGKVITVKVSKGQQVKTGDVVLILEAMKMEQEITAPVSGTVKDIPVSGGQTVTKNQALIILE